MKTIRVLLAVSIVALFAGGVASANCGSCESKSADKAAQKECAAKCDKSAVHCEDNCDKPCCKKECTEADKAKCAEQKMSCCEQAAKDGKDCAKCKASADGK